MADQTLVTQFVQGIGHCTGLFDWQVTDVQLVKVDPVCLQSLQ